jgi:photosystem II stability/assembly factor-like uncharacterized protein
MRILAMMFFTKLFCLYILSITIFIGCLKIKDPLDLKYWEANSDLEGGFNKLFFIDENIGWAVGSGGRIVSTEDGGVNWIEQNSNVNSGLKSLFFMDEKTGYVSGNDQTLLYTNDGGQNWDRKIVVCDSGKIFSSVHSDSEGNIWFISNYGEIFNSTDLGISWECKSKLNNWGFSYLFFSNNLSGIAMPVIHGSMLKTDDGFETWKSVSLPVQWIGDVCFIDENNGWISENWGPSSAIHETVSIFITNDGGETWTKLAGFPGFFIDNIVFVDNNYGWLTTTSKIFHTIDGGRSWINQYDSDTYDIGFIKDLFFINRENGWGLTTKGKIIRYFDK